MYLTDHARDAPERGSSTNRDRYPTAYLDPDSPRGSSTLSRSLIQRAVFKSISRYLSLSLISLSFFVPSPPPRLTARRLAALRKASRLLSASTQKILQVDRCHNTITEALQPHVHWRSTFLALPEPLHPIESRCHVCRLPTAELDSTRLTHHHFPWSLVTVLVGRLFSPGYDIRSLRSAHGFQDMSVLCAFSSSVLPLAASASELHGVSPGPPTLRNY